MGAPGCIFRADGPAGPTLTVNGEQNMASAEFKVNESKFMLREEEEHERYLADGEVLPSGQVVGELLEYAHRWQIYITADGAHCILAADRELAERWVSEGYVPQRAFGTHHLGQEELCLLCSPSGIILQGVNHVRFHGSLRYALSLAGAMYRSRTLNYEANLRDGIYCELYSVILPAYTQARPVADRAVFQNAIASSPQEVILTPGEMERPGVSLFTVQDDLRRAGYPVPELSSWLQPGEFIDDFVSGAQGLVACGPVTLHERYQIHHTSQDLALLLLDNDYADELMEWGLLTRMHLDAIQVNSRTHKVLVSSKRCALDALNDRHFGFTREGAFCFAQAVRRTRERVPGARLDTAVYVAEQGLLLPVEFDGGGPSGDPGLVSDILTHGPFAAGAFLEDHVADCAAIAARR